LIYSVIRVIINT